jgi:hypothetical protein
MHNIVEKFSDDNVGRDEKEGASWVDNQCEKAY